MVVQRHRGLSLVGLLVTMVCLVALFAIGLSSLNKAVTGEGSAVEGTVRSRSELVVGEGGVVDADMDAASDARDASAWARLGTDSATF